MLLKNYISRDPEGMMKVPGKNWAKSHLAMMFPFIRRYLEISRKKEDFMDSISVLSIIIAMFENLLGKLDDDMPELLRILFIELNHQLKLPARKKSKPLMSMIFQAISMAFTYNPQLVFLWLENATLTQQVFNSWFSAMGAFKMRFELRRIIFGLTAIIKTPPE